MSTAAYLRCSGHETLGIDGKCARLERFESGDCRKWSTSARAIRPTIAAAISSCQGLAANANNSSTLIESDGSVERESSPTKSILWAI